METSNFLLDCLLAIAIVFLVLGILSLSIRLLITFFPEKLSDDDFTLIAAITTHMHNVNPQTHITKIEEQK